MFNNAEKTELITRKDLQGFWLPETTTLEKWYKRISKNENTENVSRETMVSVLTDYANENEFIFIQNNGNKNKEKELETELEKLEEKIEKLEEKIENEFITLSVKQVYKIMRVLELAELTLEKDTEIRELVEEQAKFTLELLTSDNLTIKDIEQAEAHLILGVREW